MPVISMDKIPSTIWNLLWGFPVSPDSKSDAEFWLSAGELWLVVFAIVVGIGLIGEHKAENAEKKWLPERKGWTWVVIVGILGELFCDADIWVSSDVLQAISDKQLEDTRKVAAEANEAAAKANENVAKANQRTAWRARLVMSLAAGTSMIVAWSVIGSVPL
jgi:hypothetical protein